MRARQKKRPVSRETFELGTTETRILAAAIQSGLACSKTDAARKALIYWGEHNGISPITPRKQRV